MSRHWLYDKKFITLPYHIYPEEKCRKIKEKRSAFFLSLKNRQL